MSAASYDPRIRAYFGDDMLRAGFVPLPHLFLRHYRKLGLSHLQALFVLQLMEIAWDVGDPPSTVTRLAERLGVDRRTVQICSKELNDLGLVEIFDQWDQTGAQIENGYDLGPLFRRLADVDEQPAARALVRRSRKATAPSPPVPAAGAEAPSPAPITPPRSTDHASPRSVDHSEVEPVIVLPAHGGSGLNRNPKKQAKKQQKAAKNHHNATQPPGDTSGTSDGKRGGGDGNLRLPAKTNIPHDGEGRSLRWNVALSTEDVARSRAILENGGLHRHVAATAATALHPAEAWTLRLYARAARLGPAWIARQVYDFGTKQPQAPTVSTHYDEAGRLFAELPPDAAEHLCDVLDHACPTQAATVLEAAASVPDGRDEATGALVAGWALMAQQRGAPLHLQASARSSPPPLASPEPAGAEESVWRRVLARLEAEIAPDAFATWLAPTVVLEHEPDLLVVGTPNVFVRDEVATTYQHAIEAALQAELGHVPGIEVVIGSAEHAVP